jgi:hypothetical protein
MRLDAERALGKLLSTREPYRQVWTALMGDGTGIVQDPDDLDYCFVRVHGLQNSVARILNKAVPNNRPDLQVLIGTTREQPHLVQVLQVDWESLPDWGGAVLLPTHGADHEVPGADPVYIQKRAIVPLRASPQFPPDMTMAVAADFYPWDDGFNYFEGSDTEDLVARIPTGGQHRFVTIYVDGATNTLAYLDGDAASIIFPLGAEAIEMPPEGSVPVCAARLYTGQTEIVEEDIYDLRILISPTAGSLAPATHPLDPIAGRHSGRLDTRHLWAPCACTGAQN